uniref:Globoside alpha-1,3-N-acetylgalactosaminyltransferase 1 (FORS blood group) n=1 Tax=Sinocyclocheilus rhinocerous TaxID=307959 RepID=A0A673GC88_9TELE
GHRIHHSSTQKNKCTHMLVFLYMLIFINTHTINDTQHNQIQISKSLTLLLSGQNGSKIPLDCVHHQGVRTDVASVTSWSAPILWEGTFDPILIDSIYKQQNLTIAATVFALGKYTRFVKDFLESAEQHYFVEFRVHYYLFTDQPESVPEVKMGENRSLTVRKVQSLNRWQDISMGRMEKLEKLIENELASEADYIFCLDIDTKFYGHWAVESLGRLVGVIHPWFFDAPRDRFTYERRPESQAYIPAGEGDYYYAGAAFGGSLEDVHHLTKTCREQLHIDAANSTEAAWQEESHLNNKLLSPEYMWRDINESAAQIKVIRFSNVAKNYAEVRPNP